MTVVIVVLIVLLDQITKYLAVTYVKPQISVPLIEGVFNFTYHENKGAFLGLFADNRWVFLIASTVAIIAMTVYLIKAKNVHILVRISVAMLIGGGIGNMIDRTVLGYVIDFLDAAIIRFPIFNVADSFITIGAGLMIVYLLFFELKSGKKGRTSADVSDFEIRLGEEKKSHCAKSGEDAGNVPENIEITDFSEKNEETESKEKK